MKRNIGIILFILSLTTLTIYAQNKTESKLKKKHDKTEQKEQKQNEQLKEEKKIQKNTDKKIEQQKKKYQKKPVKRTDLKKIDKTSKIKKVKFDTSDHQQSKYKKKYKHVPYRKKKVVQEIHYHNPIQYHYTVPAKYIYRGLWVRIYFNYDNGFYFYNGYPYYVYHNVLHRYSNEDPGEFDLVDSYTDKVYATFYGHSLRQSYDRCAEIRDILNDEAEDYRYFCAERFEYDPDYYYDWDPDDYPDWYWY
jgi:hypothetical protein